MNSIFHRVRRLATLRLALLGLLFVIPLSQIRAQVLDEVFPPGVPGYGATPGITVLSRLHPEFTSRGIDYGALTILPGLSLGGGYDSNPNGIAAASAVGRFAPSLRIADPLLGIGAYASGTLNRYAADPSQNTSELTTGIGLDVPFGAGSVTAGAAHLVTNETAFGVNTLGVNTLGVNTLGLGTATLAAPIKVSVNDARAKASFTLGMIEVTPGLGVDGEQFGTASISGALPPNAAQPLSAQNRVVLHQSLTFIAKPPGILNYTLLLRADEARYAIPLAGAADQNSTTAESLAGIATDTGGLWHARILAGVAHQISAGGLTPSRTTPVIEFGLGWMPDELTALDLTVARRIDLSTATGALASTLTTSDLAIAEEYLRNLTLTAELSTQNSQGTQAHQQVIDAKAGFIWHLSREIAATGEYRYETTSGNLVRPAHDNLITMAVQWTP
jgi:hypothetical protein